MQYNTIQYNTMQYNTMQYNTIRIAKITHGFSQEGGVDVVSAQR